MAILTTDDFLTTLEKSKLATRGSLEQIRKLVATSSDAKAAAKLLVKRRVLTRFQANQLLAGNHALRIGPYRLRDRVLSSSTGTIYAAQSGKERGLVALKVLSPSLLEKADSLARLEERIDKLNSLTHPGICGVVGRRSEGTNELLLLGPLHGESLGRRVAREGQLTIQVLVKLIRQGADALAAAHMNGLVHAALTPDHLICDKRNQVRIMDFAASELEDIEASADYSAPERCGDAPAAPPEDIYSLGCILYFVLTGNPPFPGGTAEEKRRRHAEELPASVLEFRQDVPSELIKLCIQMMAKRPERRPQSAAMVAAAIKQCIASGDISRARDHAVSDSDVQDESDEPTKRRKGVVFSIVGVCGIGAVVLTVMLLVRLIQPSGSGSQVQPSGSSSQDNQPIAKAVGPMEEEALRAESEGKPINELVAAYQRALRNSGSESDMAFGRDRIVSTFSTSADKWLPEASAAICDSLTKPSPFLVYLYRKYHGARNFRHVFPRLPSRGPFLFIVSSDPGCDEEKALALRHGLIPVDAWDLLSNFELSVNCFGIFEDVHASQNLTRFFGVEHDPLLCLISRVTRVELEKAVVLPRGARASQVSPTQNGYEATFPDAFNASRHRWEGWTSIFRGGVRIWQSEIVRYTDPELDSWLTPEEPVIAKWGDVRVQAKVNLHGRYSASARHPKFLRKAPRSGHEIVGERLHELLAKAEVAGIMTPFAPLESVEPTPQDAEYFAVVASILLIPYARPYFYSPLSTRTAHGAERWFIGDPRVLKEYATNHTDDPRLAGLTLGRYADDQDARLSDARPTAASEDGNPQENAPPELKRALPNASVPVSVAGKPEPVLHSDKPSEEHEKAVAEIEKLGGLVLVTPKYMKIRLGGSQISDYDLRHFLGLENRWPSITVSLYTPRITNVALEVLGKMTGLTSLHLYAPRITDVGLMQLKGLTSLTSLTVFSTKITSARLGHLKGLTELTLFHAQVGGLGNLKELTRLTHLGLAGTHVTDAGLEPVKGLFNLQYLDLTGTKITDAGLAHFEGLANLEQIILLGTQVTDEGVEKLKESLRNPKLSILRR